MGRLTQTNGVTIVGCNIASDGRTKVSVIESPCVDICLIDASGAHCTGCYRTLDEIGAWATMTPAERRAVMDQLDARMEAAFEQGGG